MVVTSLDFCVRGWGLNPGPLPVTSCGLSATPLTLLSLASWNRHTSDTLRSVPDYCDEASLTIKPIVIFLMLEGLAFNL